MTEGNSFKTQVNCHHCGDPCEGKYPEYQNHPFCCEGCQTIYQLLTQNGLSKYYDIDALPGVTQKKRIIKDFSFLEQPEVSDRLLIANIGDTQKVKLLLPTIHCASCIWLLENLFRLHEGVRQCQVNFLKREATITYDKNEISLKGVAELLSKIGYEPSLSMSNLENDANISYVDRKLLYQIGVAGFCFGNIMLLSFPDYLGVVESSISKYISALLILLSLPVILFSGRDYLISAWKSLRARNPGMDLPIALGMMTLFLRSIFELVTNSGMGYMDSLSGFVLFLLIGKSFQQLTYNTISFERDYKSYFPISSLVKNGEAWISKSIDLIVKGERLLIKSEEIIPCDAILLEGKARVDYSFVTGESDLSSVKAGEIVFAGGRQKGASIIVKVEKPVNQSYLTELWNNQAFAKKTDNDYSTLLHEIGKWFTLAIILVAVLTMFYWYRRDMELAFRATTAVLIIACPCVLALSIPFIYGNAIRLLGRYQIYLKNVISLEKIQFIDTIIFDKTGTITDNSKMMASYEGRNLSDKEKMLIRSLCIHSSHPLSVAIVRELSMVETIEVDSFKEILGFGIAAEVEGNQVRIGSTEYILGIRTDSQNQQVLVEIDGDVPGSFVFENEIRAGIPLLMSQLKDKYQLVLLSGDSEREKERMDRILPRGVKSFYHQKPDDKLQYVEQLQKSGKKVMMVGDGLNDAGALKQSDVGIVITDSKNNFTPACDLILEAKKMILLPQILRFSTNLKYALYGAFFFAFLYNSIGLGFAVNGALSPIVAAILMPISSITIVVYGVLSSVLITKSIFGSRGSNNLVE